MVGSKTYSLYSSALHPLLFCFLPGLCIVIGTAGSVAVVKVGFVYQTTIHLPMDDFGALGGLEQGAIPVVDISESFRGSVDMG